MEKEDRISTLTLAILCLIGRAPHSAYQLRKAFTTTPMGHFSSSPGAVYPALRRIEAAGLITGRTANRDTLRPKRVYEITASGKEALTRHLRVPVTRDDVIWHMDDLLLRFAFMERLLDAEEILNFLRQFEAETRGYLQYLQELFGSIDEHLSVCERLAFEHGIRSYRSNLNWVRSAIREVSRAKAKIQPPGR
jgi:DNA-binding PadR family transcriptional regulator